MKPTINDVGKFWWFKNGDDDPEVVRVDYNKHRNCLVVWFTGWEIDDPVEEFNDDVWLGEVKPFDEN